MTRARSSRAWMNSVRRHRPPTRLRHPMVITYENVTCHDFVFLSPFIFIYPTGGVTKLHYVERLKDSGVVRITSRAKYVTDVKAKNAF